jgi:PTS system cellobiose-specific IIB component
MSFKKHFFGYTILKKEALKMKLMVSCIGGISTALLVERIEAAARDENIDCQVWSVPETQIVEEIGKFDVLLVTTPVNKTRIKSLLHGRYPIDEIELGEYTTLDGHGVLHQAMELYQAFYQE